MNSIGIVGRGFVGTAVFEGMKHAFNVFSYDLAKGWVHCLKGSTPCPAYNRSGNQIKNLMEQVDGPIFVCVPTPMRPDGSCDTSVVEDIVQQIDDLAVQVKNPDHDVVVIVKSTILPGTTQKLNDCLHNIYVCFNPEFLTERSHIEDFKHQDRIIIGGPHRGTSIVKQMYQTAYPAVPITKTSSTIAELVKYLTNSFLAVKVAFANEIEQICGKLEVDYDKVVEYATKDKRLGNTHWSVPGPDGKKGFSGSCLPKDLNALMVLADKLGVDCKTMNGAWQTNLKVRPERDWELLKGRAVTNSSGS